MVFVDLLFRTPCFRSWLHREDYKFENEVDDVVAEGPTSSFSFRNHRPKRYLALLGFKDRNLEDEYLEDLARSKKASVFVGYAIAIVLFFVGSFLDSLQQIPMNKAIEEFTTEQRANLGEYEYGGSMTAKENTPIALTMAFLVIGLAATVVINLSKSVHQKRLVLNLCSLVFTLYIALMGYFFSWSWNVENYVYGAGAWPIVLTVYILSPLLALMSMQLPSSITFQLMSLVSIVFLLILPLVQNMFAEFSHENWMLSLDPVWVDECNDDLEVACVQDWKFKVVFPYVLLWTMVVGISVVSEIQDRENRRAWENKRVMEVQMEKLAESAKKREEYLVEEHKKKEDTIIEMFKSF